MTLSIIAAVGENRVIGRDGGLPWRLPADMRRFKSLTMGHPVIMGRRTFDSLGRPLPGRTNIVVTRRRDYRPQGVLVAHSLEEALALTEGEEEIFIAGGGEIYREALPLADRLYLTLVHGTFPGDTFFPELSEANWKLVSREDHPADDRHAFPYSFLVYDRRR